MSFHGDRMAVVNIEELRNFFQQRVALGLQSGLAGLEQQLVGEYADDESPALDHRLDLVAEAVCLGVRVELLL
jgi:hypothetical protein